MGLYLDDKNRPRSQTSVSPSQNLPQTPPMPHGKRANAGKLRFSLLSSFALTGLVKVLEYGAEKYTERDEAGNVLVSGADNWRKGLSWKATVDSLMRHTLALMAGEDIDPESGLPHVHHMQCNTMFLAHFFETKTGSDDR